MTFPKIAHSQVADRLVADKPSEKEELAFVVRELKNITEELREQNLKLINETKIIREAYDQKFSRANWEGIYDYLPDSKMHEFSQSVGLLHVDWGGGIVGNCSGILVSDRLFLTAAHCFDAPEKREGDAQKSSVTLEMGLIEPKDVSLGRTSTWAVKMEPVELSPTNGAIDYMILEVLPQKLDGADLFPGKIFGYQELNVSTSSYAEQTKTNFKGSYPMFIVHYPNGAVEGKVITRWKCHSTGIRIEEKARPEKTDWPFPHNCDTDVGSSGGPVVMLDTYEVVGVHTGSIHNGRSNTLNAFSSLNDMVAFSEKQQKVLYNLRQYGTDKSDWELPESSIRIQADEEVRERTKEFSQGFRTNFPVERIGLAHVLHRSEGDNYQNIEGGSSTCNTLLAGTNLTILIPAHCLAGYYEYTTISNVSLFFPLIDDDSFEGTPGRPYLASEELQDEIVNLSEFWETQLPNDKISNLPVLTYAPSRPKKLDDIYLYYVDILGNRRPREAQCTYLTNASIFDRDSLVFKCEDELPLGVSGSILVNTDGEIIGMLTGSSNERTEYYAQSLIQ